MVGLDSNKWLGAMKSEIGSMYENKVWTLVDLPDERQAIENKWIFKNKTNADGNATICEARLVSKKFRQVQGVDYDETLSIIAMLKSVRTMLAVAAFSFTKSGRWMSKQSFLDGFLEERLYVIQPESFCRS